MGNTNAVLSLSRGILPRITRHVIMSLAYHHDILAQEHENVEYI
jgi:hypothetical protein